MQQTSGYELAEGVGLGVTKFVRHGHSPALVHMLLMPVCHDVGTPIVIYPRALAALLPQVSQHVVLVADTCFRGSPAQN